MTSSAAQAAFRIGRRVAGDPRQVRPDHLRPVVPAGPAADRGRRVVRHDQRSRAPARWAGTPTPRTSRRSRTPSPRRSTRGSSALLDDLAERRLLDSTLVVMMGEFGRTPEDQPQRRPRPPRPGQQRPPRRRGHPRRPRPRQDRRQGRQPRPTAPSPRPTSPPCSTASSASTPSTSSKPPTAGRSGWSTGQPPSELI